MKTYLYTCKHCFKEFSPTRRGVQKFCSDSCRASHHQCNNRNKQKLQDSLVAKNGTNGEIEKFKKEGKNKEKGKSKTEEMSISGIGNAAAGTALVDTIKHMFTPEHNKPATKGDLVKLGNHLSRYHRIKNLKPNIYGHFPCLEVETGNLVYLPKESLKLK